MKIYSNSQTINIDITVEFYGDIIDGAKTVPVGKMRLSPEEMFDFTDFVEDIGALMDAYEFEIKDEHPSRYVTSASYYYAFYPTDSDLEVCYEKLYFLRISTHERKSEDSNPFPKYYHDTAQKYKMPKDKIGNQQHKHIKIIVNDENYDNYDDAYDAMQRKFETIQKRSDKLNGK